ncbi:MAG: nuclear transport factor 2 family protein [Pseudomonadota bacterium]
MSDAVRAIEDRFAIEAVLVRYARACDTRDWQLFEDVFDPDVNLNYGGLYQLKGIEGFLEMVRGMLGGCGPTLHTLSNFTINLDGDRATSSCFVRAIHAGLGSEADTYYEVWAEYRDTLRRCDSGWRVTTRHMQVLKEVGSRDILRPAQSG